MNDILHIGLRVIEWSLLLSLMITALYLFIFSFAGVFRRNRTEIKDGNSNKFAVLIPGYKEDAVIVNTAREALQQNYPSDKYDVVVIADSFDLNTLKKLKKLPIKLIEVSFEKSTKSKALNEALSQLGDAYDVALILDADNIMERDFLSKINESFKQDFQVVQGRRIAKNLNTSFAVLDGISEAVNNHIFRNGHRALGLSSGLIGSGMAFDFKLFKSLMKEVTAVGGFDKELEFRLFKGGFCVEYVSDALVYDEKIQHAGDFKNQRRRWLSTKQVYFAKFLKEAIVNFITKGKLDMLNKLVQMIMPTRVILLGSLTCMVVIQTLMFIVFEVWPLTETYKFWVLTWLMTVLVFVMAVPRSFYNKTTLKSLWSLPRAFGMMFLLLFKLKGANDTFIHTNHSAIINQDHKS